MDSLLINVIEATSNSVLKVSENFCFARGLNFCKDIKYTLLSFFFDSQSRSFLQKRRKKLQYYNKM